MDLNHLHLHVRDVERARHFYETYFELRERVRHGGILFLGNADGFNLALAPDPEPAALPGWWHMGFRLAGAADVKRLHHRMWEAGVTLLKPLAEEPGYVTFQCADPDGYRIEVYWE